MNMIRGELGLMIPKKKPIKLTQFALTTDAVMKWRSNLPMADTGSTAKKVYISLIPNKRKM